jgi:hypothetical protein
MFKTTSRNPLHNLLSVSPISYILLKLMHSYALRLQGLPPNAKVYMVLDTDQCHYWPIYVNPPTNLSWASFRISSSIYWLKDPYTARLWLYPWVIHEPLPPNPTSYKKDLAHLRESDIHIFIFTYTHRDHPYALYSIKSNGWVSYRKLERETN